MDKDARREMTKDFALAIVEAMFKPLKRRLALMAYLSPREKDRAARRDKPIPCESGEL
jgi:hypothetical protein